MLELLLPVVVDGMREERERERKRERKREVNIMARPRIFANLGDIPALDRPTNARRLL